MEAVRCAGLLIPLLLFADDIAIPSRSLEVLQRLVAALSVFCTRNKLVVNLGKPGWLVGGCPPRSGTDGLCLWFNRCAVTPVSSYKYLGLVFDGSSSMTSATTARLTAA